MVNIIVSETALFLPGSLVKALNADDIKGRSTKGPTLYLQFASYSSSLWQADRRPSSSTVSKTCLIDKSNAPSGLKEESLYRPAKCLQRSSPTAQWSILAQSNHSRE